MNTHTPGPWAISEGKMYANEVCATTKRGKKIAVARVGGGPEFRDGNARLIAAAPDALEFAIFYDAYMADQFPDGLQTNYDNKTLHPRAAEAWGRCKSYIAKALGTEHS